MKRYKFRLQSVLRVRSIERDVAVGRVAMARRDLAAATLQREQREQRLEDQSAPVSGTADELRAHVLTLNYAADAVLYARKIEQACTETVAMHLAAWIAADRSVRLLEELEVRHRLVHTAENFVTEQHELDDLITSRVGRSTR